MDICMHMYEERMTRLWLKQPYSDEITSKNKESRNDQGKQK